MIPRLRPALGWKELKAAFSPSGGDDVRVFEKEFSRIAGQKHAVAFPYGRTGLIAILKALGLHGGEVICPSYTCVVVPHAIVVSGNKPVFLDSNRVDLNMDLNLVDEAVTPETRVIVATSIFGYPVNLDLLDGIRHRYPGIIVVQDCAHSFFCEWRGRSVHKEGLCAIYGLNISKMITSIFGGMVTTDDSCFAERLMVVRDEMLSSANILKFISRALYLLAVYPAFSRAGYQWVNWLEHSGLLDRFVKYYNPTTIDMPRDYLQAMAPIEARVGKVQCSRYPDIIKHRRKLARIYFEGLKEAHGIQLPAWNDGATWSHFVVRTSCANELIKGCLDEKVQLGELIEYDVPSMSAYKQCKVIGGNSSHDLPGKVINLPVHTGVLEKDARRLVGLIIDLLKKSLIC